MIFRSSPVIIDLEKKKRKKTLVSKPKNRNSTHIRVTRLRILSRHNESNPRSCRYGRGSAGRGRRCASPEYQGSIRTNTPIEAFLLFAQEVPSNNLGMIDPRAPAVEIPINGKDYTIHQSPSLLSSHRAGGTTGAGAYERST